MFEIKVPASSANVGPGFDSAGIAIGKYLTLEVTKSSKWKFIHNTELIPDISHYKNHFIYKIAKQVADDKQAKLNPAEVIMNTEIPLARGLGSSASAIVAGIELANQLAELNLSTTDKLAYAVKFEGHPDNVAPCLLGGFIVSSVINGNTFYKQLPSFKTDSILYIPNFEVKTDKARDVLPKKLTLNNATQASAISNVMLSALLTEDYELAGKMMEEDLFHEPYRAKLIPHYKELKSLAKKSGAFGTIISGAGPTMISFAPTNKTLEIIKNTKEAFPGFEITQIKLDNNGLIVK